MPSVSLLNDQFSHDFQYVLALTRYDFYKSACCAGLMLRRDAQSGSSQAATNNSCRLYPMPKAISAIACVFSKLEAWWKSVVRRGAQQKMSGSPRKGARRPLKFQEVMTKE